MNSLQHYVKLFGNLRRAPGAVWQDATKRRAPHKPLLLLAVIDMFSRGAISSGFIDVGGNLVELNELFSGYWRSLRLTARISSIAFPFSRLHNEPFWKLVPIPGKEITAALLNNISTMSQLRQVVLGAQMDEDLVRHLRTPEGRSTLREALIQTCFSEGAQSSLKEKVAMNDQAFEYSKVIEERSHQVMVSEPDEAVHYETAVRGQGFRRAVIIAYDHRCALCGVRIITPEGHSAVDAAHIIPWSVSHNDDIRNGLALCKLCHWAFDRGMMGVSDGYSVIVSRQISSDINVPGFLQTLSGRGIIPPQDYELRPAHECIVWHRKHFSLDG